MGLPSRVEARTQRSVEEWLYLEVNGIFLKLADGDQWT